MPANTRGDNFDDFVAQKKHVLVATRPDPHPHPHPNPSPNPTPNLSPNPNPTPDPYPGELIDDFGLVHFGTLDIGANPNTEP